MLKYLFAQEVFREVPNEIALGISISGCKICCKGCHSPWLWEDMGRSLDINRIQELLDSHKGVTCLLLLGGEADIDSLIEIFQHFYGKIKTAWYCGLEKVPEDKKGITQYLDYLKVGRYREKLGGLDVVTTNQRMYKILHAADDSEEYIDITPLFRNKQI